MTSTLLCLAALTSAPGLDIDRGGYTIHCDVMGKGRPVIAIPGGPGFSGRSLWSIGFELQDKAEVLLFDQLGTGQSRMKNGKAPASLNLKSTLADIDSIRKRLGLKKITLFGQSWGAIVAVGYAAYYPENCDKIVVASVPGFNPEDFKVLSSNLAIKLAADPSSDTASQSLEQQILGVLPYYFYDIELGRKLGSKAPDGIFSGPVFQQLSVGMDGAVTAPFPKLLKRWKGSALILQGHQDVTGGAMGYRLQKILPNSRVVMFDQAGHFSWLEPAATDGFFSEFRQFLGLGFQPGFEPGSTEKLRKEAAEMLAKRRESAGWPFGR